MTKTKQFGNAALRRPRIAAAGLSGKKLTEIAQDESITRSQASRDVNAAETKQVICELVEKQHVRGSVDLEILPSSVVSVKCSN